MLFCVAVSFLASLATAAGQGICSRTPQVRDELMEVTGISTCEAVTSERLASLTALNLTQSGITRLQTHDFDGLSSLQGLWLSANSLSELPEGVFRGLGSLKWLGLDSNSLSQLPEAAFSGLSNLQQLDLGFNQLSELPDRVFSGLRSLEVLWLTNNFLRELPEGIFNGLNSLKQLELGINSLRSLPEGIFSGLINLRNLVLLGNPLSTLPASIFSGLNSLEFLHMLNIPLRILPEGIFDDILDTLGADPYNTGLGLIVESHLKAGLAFTSTAQTGFEGTNVKARVILSRPLPVAVHVPFTVAGTATTQHYSNLSPDPGAGLMFLAGERVKEISFTLPRGKDLLEKIIVLKLGELSRIGLRRSDGTGPDALYLNTETLLGRFDRYSVHTVTISARDPVSDLEGICDRTPLVRDALMEIIGLSVCSEVTAEHLAGVTELDLSESGIRTLQEHDFRGLSNLQHLLLHTNDLSELPEDVFNQLPALENLQLHNNFLNALPEGVFRGLSNLEALGLSSNLLNALPEGVFSGLSNLERLQLGSNSLSELPEDAFSDLGNLEFLDLQSNFLTALPEDAFRGLSSLRDLSLGENAMTTLPDGVFSKLNSVETLSLRYNALGELPRGAVRGLSNLQALQLQGNSLSELPEGIFSGLGSLQILDWSTNFVSTFPEGIFDELDSLKWLILVRNRLRVLPEKVFSGLHNLERLHLYDNRLTTLPENVFSGLNSLKELWLHYNPLNRFPNGVFDDVLDTLGQSFELPFFIGLTGYLYTFIGNNPAGPVDSRHMASLAFAFAEQRTVEGNFVRIPVTLSRALPVAVRVPYTVGTSGIAGGLTGLSPATDSGLLFRAGETRKEIGFHVPKAPGRQADGTVVVTLGYPSEIGLRRADGTGPDAPYLLTKAFLIPTDEGAVHTITVTASDPVDREPYCLSLWSGSVCSTVASFPHVLMGPLGKNIATTEVVITHKDPEAAGCEAAVLFHRGTSQAPPVSFNGRFLDNNLLRTTIPQGGARILTLAAPDAEQLVAGAVSVFARSPCTADSLHVQGRTLLENKIDGEIEEIFSMATQSPGDWMEGGDCRVLTGVFGNGRNVGFASITAEPGQSAPSGTRLDIQAFDLEGNFIGPLPGLEISGDYQAVSPWSFDEPTIVEMCLDVPGKSPFQLAVTAIGSKAAGGGMQFVTERFSTEPESEETASEP